MTPNRQRPEAFTLVEILLVTAVVGIVAGLGVVAVTGVRENARETRLRNDVTVLNNGIDAYRAAGGVIPADLPAEQVVAKLKTVADPTTSTAFGPSGPFIDPRLQLLRQSAQEGALPEARADYPNAAGYFYVRQGGAPGIKDFVRGEPSPIVTEVRQGSMPYTPGGGFVTAYTDRTAATPVSAVAPQAAAGTDEPVVTGKDLVKFPRPTLELRYGGSSEFRIYGGESLSLKELEDPVTKSVLIEARVSSPSVSSQAQLRLGWDGAAMNSVGSPSIRSNIDIKSYTGPRPFVAAQVFSLDTTRYTNSDPLLVTINTIPAQVEPVFPVSSNIPASLNYLEAGGAMYVSGVLTSNARPPVAVSLSNIEKVPVSFLSLLSGGLTVTYTRRYTGTVDTTTNSSFSAAGGFQPGIVPIDVTGFGSATSIDIYASVQSANSNILVSGQSLSNSILLRTTPLTVDVLPLKPIGLPPSVVVSHSGDVPVGMRKFYTLTQAQSGAAPLNPTNGGVPSASAILYSAPITSYPIATYTVVAQATGPVGAEHWFTCSPVNRTYIAITTVPLKYIGLNMFRANINGHVKGSIYMQAGDFAVLNAGAYIEGNVYLPGTPSVFLPASGALVVRQGQAYDQSKDALIDTNRITGREYDTEGKLADPQQDLRKIVDLYGSTTPRNYEFRGTETSRIDGKLYRRADPPPVTTQKPGLPPEIALSNAPVTVSGTQLLQSGSYAVTLDNTNSVLQLGRAGTLTKYVFGAGSTWTAGRVEIAGPVQVFFNSNVSMSGITFGNSNSIYQTGFVVMSNYSVSIGSGATVYGQFEARDSVLSVGNDGAFYGSAFALEVAVAGRGYVDVSGGSDTNAVTSTNTP